MQLRAGNLGNRGIRWVLFTLIYTRWVLFTLPNTNCSAPGSIAEPSKTKRCRMVGEQKIKTNKNKKSDFLLIFY